ncbi:MAG TPA: antitoxin MazE-like protein [Acidimicrobiales bacterium]|nr:antitoxin MazE-like protein [Acidimicrobiales bacterium]
MSEPRSGESWSEELEDVRSAKFRTEARRQSLAVTWSALAQDDQDFIDAVGSGEG